MYPFYFDSDHVNRILCQEYLLTEEIHLNLSFVASLKYIVYKKNKWNT